MSVLETVRALSTPGRLKETRLRLEAGELACLVGPNGAGKSSLLGALAGIAPATGEVRIEGSSVRSLHPHARQKLLGYLSPSREIRWAVSAQALIELSLPPGSDWRRLVEPLELAPLLARPVTDLSTGERTRILIARALAPSPRVLLLDEPIANLDPYWQLMVLNLLRGVARRAECAVVMAIHDLRLAQQWGDRLIVMEEQEIVADAAPASVEQSGILERVFGVAWTGDSWCLSPAADQRSLP